MPRMQKDCVIVCNKHFPNLLNGIIIYIKEFIASDWLKAMCENDMSNEQRHNVRYDVFIHVMMSY